MDVVPTRSVSIIGCGWLGWPLAKELLEEGYQVKGSTTSQDKLEPLRESGIDAYLFRLGDESQSVISRLLSSDTVIINIPPGRSDPDVLNKYPEGIRQLLAGAVDAGVESIVYISTTGVYANNNSRVDESSTCTPQRPSAMASLKAESIIRSSGVAWTILRMAGLVGGDREPGRCFAGRSDIPHGDMPVNMVHRDDCIRAIRTVLKRPLGNDVFNICAENHPSKKNFYRHQANKIEVQPPTFLDGKGSYKMVDNQKFKSHFGFEYVFTDPRLF